MKTQTVMDMEVPYYPTATYTKVIMSMEKGKEKDCTFSKMGPDTMENGGKV